MPGRQGRGRAAALGWLLPALLLSLGAVGDLPAAPPRAKRPPRAVPPLALPYDRTFRPTVIVRKGPSQGSGTVIASADGETLVLTAAHVALAKENGALRVELHRYNLGVERSLPEEGWPLRLPAELVAADAVGDVALLRVSGRPALPFVAELAAEGDAPGPGDRVYSVGIDGGEALTGWTTRVRDAARFALDPDRSGGPALVATKADRPFLLTARAPALGRSGGGLYSEAGKLVGVCVGRVESGEGGKVQGLFGASDTARDLLRKHDLQGRLARPGAHPTGRGAVTPTRSAPARP